MASTIFQKRHVEQAVIARTKELQSEIGHRRQAEIALIRERDRAESANRAKSVFLSTMSHELRTPLNAIIGFSSILSSPDPIPEDKAQDYAREINSGGSKLLDLINDILDITQMDAEDAGAEDEINVGDLLESLLAKLTPEANQAGIGLECTVPAGLPYLSGDKRRIAKALQHLLGNAIKFGRKDGFARIAVCADEIGLAITIADDGIGMPPGAEARIVHLFAQADSALARHHEGIGLGLTFVHRVAEKHGARLEIKSRLGEGTHIALLFPPGRLIRAAPVKEVA
jgi:signal transduction histidine kinase